MNLDVAAVFGNIAYAPPPDGGYLVIRDPNFKVFDDIIISNIKQNRFQDPSRNLYMLLDGSAYIRYGSSEVYPLNSPNNPAEWVPIASPYTSSEWTDYVNNWNYSEDFCMRVNEHTVFASVYFKDGPPSNLIAKVASCASTATKSLAANSTLIVVKRDKIASDINGESMPMDASIVVYPVSAAQDVTVNVPDSTFYMVYLQYE
jgi:hypothetical protein